MSEVETGRRLLRTILLQGAAVAAAGGVAWLAAWAAGWGRDAAWTLASIIWILGSPAIDIARTIRSRRNATRG